ncbi:MAG TPA: hypothetical protein VKT70_04790, partial [Stellaceae bacterium]|nr:hypothetical protein [Stellaceae bacterium]
LANGGAELAAAFERLSWQRLEEIGNETPGGQFSRVNAIVAALREDSLPGLKLSAAARGRGTVASVKPRPGAIRFEDDPRAKRDPGSTERLGRAEAFGRSPSGSSLA